MTPVWLDGQIASEFVAQFVPGGANYLNPRGLGVISKDGSLVASIVLHNWSPSAQTIEISAAAISGHSWATRGVLNTLFDYVYETCGCYMAVAISPKSLKSAESLWLKIGADITVIPHLSGPGQPANVFTLTREQWHSSKFRRSP